MPLMLGSTRTGEPLVPLSPATPPRAGPERMRWILTLEDAGVRQRRIGVHVTSELQNWSGTYRFTARELVNARTIEDVQRAVAAGGRVRALGTRHSFNDLADNGATLVSVTGIAADPVIDEAAGTVTAGAGVSYGTLASVLQARGWAWHTLGSLPHISVGGATATATHGSGSRNQILSAALAG